MDLIEVWEPQEGEWCMFWDNYDECIAVHISMYSGTAGEFFRSADDYTWHNCAKFTGELPEQLKEK